MQSSTSSHRSVVLAVIGVLVLTAALVVVLVFGGGNTVRGSASPADGDGPMVSRTAPAPSADDPASDAPATDGRDPGAAAAEVGDCIKMRGENEDKLAKLVDCDAPDAVYEVAYRYDGRTSDRCPTESYDSYTQSGPDGVFLLCTIMNGVKGDCFTGYSDPNEQRAKVSCPTADVRITKRLDGRVDPSVCPAGSEWQLLYPLPAPGRTVCMEPLLPGLHAG